MIRWIAALLRRERPKCLACRWPLGVDRSRLVHRPHVTFYDSPILGSSPRAIVALCSECWRRVTPEEKVDYYREVWIESADPAAPPGYNATCWQAIETALRVGG